MDYEKAYKDAFARFELCERTGLKPTKEYIFPELAESEDEKIRKEITDFICWATDRGSITPAQVEKSNSWLAWLEKQGEYKSPEKVLKIRQEVYQSGYNDGYKHGCEDTKKQGEQKLDDKIEPKFKVGDWIVCNSDIDRVERVSDRFYHFETGDCGLIKDVDEDYHLWTIQDAKDGDVLATENFIFIFKNIDDGNGVHYYCQYEISKHEDDNQFDIALPQSLMGRVGNSISHYSPATKEQRNLLFQKMKEAGYEWDAGKKELKKIEQNPTWSEEDDEIRKAIHIYLDWLDGRKEVAPKGEYSIRDMITWLLKQKPHNVPSSTELLAEWEDVEKRLQERRYEGQWQLAYDAFLEGFLRGAKVNSLKEVQEEPISESFQEWEKRYLEEHKDEIINVYDRHAGLIDGAIWQAFRTTKNAIEREVKVDAGGYPYIDATELYDYTEDKPLAKAGDKVKLIIIKGE